MPITPFGKQVRKYRIDADATLSDMATNFGVSPAFLSAVEMGRKALNDELVKRYIAFFSKCGIRADDLVELADRGRKQVDVDSLAEEERSAVAALARKLSGASKARRREIMEFILKVQA